MATTRFVQDLLAPVDDASAAPLPPCFAETLGEVRAALARCGEAGFPESTMLAALLTEWLPRLVTTHGATGAVAMLRSLADEIAAADRHAMPGP